MVSLEPRFRRAPGGRLLLYDTAEAQVIKGRKRGKDWSPACSPAAVRKAAVEEVKKAGGDVDNPKHLLGCFEIQYGQYCGMTFKWMLENTPGYAGYLVAGMAGDSADPKDSRWVNKMALKKYVEMWPEGRELVQMKTKKKGVTAPEPEADEMSDEALLQAAQDVEQLTAGCQTAGSVTTGGTLSSRELFVPTIKAQRKALLSNVGVPAKKPSPALTTAKNRPVTPSPAPTTAKNRPVTIFKATVPVKQRALSSRVTMPITETPPATATTQNPPEKVQTATSVPIIHEGLSSSAPAVSTSDGDIQRPSAQPSVLSSSAQAVSTSDGDIQRPSAQSPVDDLTTSASSQQPEDEDLCLPKRWNYTLPKADRQWVSKALFRWKTDKEGLPTSDAEFGPGHLSQLWWYPPQPAVAVNSVPGVNRYLARPLFLWMPRKQWKVKLHCPNPDCGKRELASSGINQKVRQVIDIDGTYNLACEQLQCRKCGARHLSWSHALLSQLDVGHRVQFPALLTAKLACDMKVVRLLRNRGLGNSCSQVRKKIQEQHGEKWLQKAIHYLTDCSWFASAAESGMLVMPSFAEFPDRPPIPRHRWFIQIYIQDVLLRLDEMKAGITSVFGRILKIDSTKKVVKKLAGRPAKTALWCTNVGNEHGQVLTSVMTTGEGHGLTHMLVGVIQRYTNAQVPPPEIIYADRDCCGTSPLQQVLTAADWTAPIRLDIWHFMRRIATGVTTDSHPLYASFMGLLSNCIFQWDEQDLDRLKMSKRKELKAQHLLITSDAAIMKHLSRYELALHCRRRTRGVAETTQLIEQLIVAFSGERGRDTLGVPLINDSRMRSIWNAQKKHVACIQDSPEVSLYIRTGSTKKGGVELPDYRCARGSTSLESFHLHLNRFIPGTLASDVLFQAYMVDGLHRWNEDRGRAATSTATDHHSYSGLLRHTANVLGQMVLKRKLFPAYTQPRKYTGELIGIEYLYSQNGQTMEDYKKAIDALETSETDASIETADDADEVFENTDQIDDLTISTAGLKESSDLVLEPPTLPPVSDTEESFDPLPPLAVPTPPPVPECEENIDPLPSTPTPAPRPILNIPTPEDYKAMMSDSVDQPSTEQPTDPAATRDESVSTVEDPPQTSDDPVPTPVRGSTPVGTSLAVVQDIGSDQENDESVGPDGIPGYDKVQELAAYLISLRKDTYLTNAQVTRLIHLWKNLQEYDKAPTVFEERFSKVDRGRFKAKKTVRRNVAPGVESTERIMRGGPGAVPASWPSANRYTEAIFIQLLSLLPRNKSRLDDAAQAYKNIRQLLLQNGTVITQTRLQLPEISRGTLLQWFTKRGKALDKLVVTQGVRFDKPTPATSVDIPEPLEKPTRLPTGEAEPHTFVCPPNTAGTAKVLRRKTAVSTPLPASQSTLPVIAPQTSPPVLTIPSQQPTPAVLSTIPLQTSPSAPLTVNIGGQSYQLTPTTAASTVQQLTPPSIPTLSPVPYTTQRYRKRKLEKEKEGIVKRKKPVTCKLCGQDRNPPVHVHYFMNWYCGATATISLEDWKQELYKKGYGKKQKKHP